MATTAENLLLLQTTKESFKTAIEGKGRDLTNVPFTQYPQEVEAIQTGGGENKLVYYISSPSVEIYASDIEGITEIAEQAFYYSSRLTYIELPATVTKLNKNAFNSCSNLKKVIFKGQCPHLPQNIFKNCSNVEVFDFRNCTTVPTMYNIGVFSSMKAGCKGVVPDALYDTWITADMWKSITEFVWVKASEYVEV